MATMAVSTDTEKCTSLTMALKHYFGPIEGKELIPFVKSCTDAEKEKYRQWFVANGYPKVVKTEK